MPRTASRFPPPRPPATPTRSRALRPRCATARRSRDLPARAVVRRVLRDRHVVRMALAQPGRGDADEARARLHLLDRRRAAVAHRLAQATDDLVDDPGERPLVGHATLDALGHELVGARHVALEVAILGGRARLHRAERAHAAVLLVALALHEDDLAGALVDACEQAAEHHRVGTGRDRLRDVARELHAT